MEAILYLLHLLIPTVIAIYIYFWSSSFKKLSVMSMDEMNEDETHEKNIVTIEEANGINRIGQAIFLLIGIIIWSLIGICIGRIACLVAPENFMKWFVYIGLYILFIRIPFGTANKMIKKAYGDIFILYEKVVFFLVMIFSYVASVYCYDSIPSFFKWHLYFLP